ncbi:hypothetical protein L195_g007207, partial [Trifolium pratense]
SVELSQALEVQTRLAALLIRQAGSGNWTYGWSVIHLLDGVSTQLGVDFINSDSSSHVKRHDAAATHRVIRSSKHIVIEWLQACAIQGLFLAFI